MKILLHDSPVVQEGSVLAFEIPYRDSPPAPHYLYVFSGDDVFVDGEVAFGISAYHYLADLVGQDEFFTLGGPV